MSVLKSSFITSKKEIIMCNSVLSDLNAWVTHAVNCSGNTDECKKRLVNLGLEEAFNKPETFVVMEPTQLESLIEAMNQVHFKRLPKEQRPNKTITSVKDAKSTLGTITNFFKEAVVDGTNVFVVTEYKTR